MDAAKWTMVAGAEAGADAEGGTSGRTDGGSAKSASALRSVRFGSQSTDAHGGSDATRSGRSTRSTASRAEKSEVVQPEAGPPEAADEAGGGLEAQPREPIKKKISDIC